jgi:GTP cyclohydrolase I
MLPPHQTTDEELITELLRRLGEDVSREGLQETPARVMRAWRFWMSGYGKDVKDIAKLFEESIATDELIFQAGIPIYSHCEHHMTPIFGAACIGYIPSGRMIIGLSKLSRIVDIFARRLTVQERLCRQIADGLQTILGTRGLGVVIRARHLCLESRGVQRQGTITTTSALRGCIKSEPDCRAEFMALVNHSNGD